MSSKAEALAARVQECLAARAMAVVVDRGEVTVEVDGRDLPAVALLLRDGEGLAFRQLTDLCGIDYLAWGRADWVTRAATSGGFSRGVERDAVAEGAPAGKTRFAVVYHLLSLTHNQRLRLRAFPDRDSLAIPSVVEIWPSANWYEREAFDMFGILFDGHPDLRRLLTDYGFIGHPFRKDFPLEGHVEVRYDPARGRVVYQPVSIEPRVLVPRVIRADGQHDTGAPHA